MAAAYGYTNVDDAGFLSFLEELSKAEWGAIPTGEWEGERFTVVVGWDRVPAPVLWKLRLSWSIEGLAAVLAGAEGLAEVEGTWDSKQRVLKSKLDILYEEGNASIKAMVENARAKLLIGDGTGQTALKHHKEVQFGRKQLALVEKQPLRGDIESLGLTGTMDDIRRATDNLAQALGWDSEVDRRMAPSSQVRTAMSECSSAFNGVHDDLDWSIAHTPEGEERDRLTKLRRPLEKLLDRSRSGSRDDQPVLAPSGESPTSTPVDTQPREGGDE